MSKKLFTAFAMLLAASLACTLGGDPDTGEGGVDLYNEVPSETPMPTATPTPTDIVADSGAPALPLQATLACQTHVANDPSGHKPYIKMPDGLNLTMEYDSQTDMVRVTGPDPFVAVEGTLLKTFVFAISGEGTVAGYPNIDISGEGWFDDFSETGFWLHLLYVVGADGGLPGGASIVYQIDCQQELQ